MLDDTAYATVVRAFVGAANVTTEQLASAAGTSRSTVGKVLAGRSVRDRDKVGLAAARLAGLPLEYLDVGLASGPAKADPRLQAVLELPVRDVLYRALGAV